MILFPLISLLFLLLFFFFCLSFVCFVFFSFFKLVLCSSLPFLSLLAISGAVLLIPSSSFSFPLRHCSSYVFAVFSSLSFSLACMPLLFLYSLLYFSDSFILSPVHTFLVLSLLIFYFFYLVLIFLLSLIFSNWELLFTLSLMFLHAVCEFRYAGYSFPSSGVLCYRERLSFAA